MIYSIVALCISIVLWVLFGYLAPVYEALETAAAVFMWLTIAVAAVAVVFIVLEIAMKIRNSKHKGGGGK